MDRKRSRGNLKVETVYDKESNTEEEVKKMKKSEVKIESSNQKRETKEDNSKMEIEKVKMMEAKIEKDRVETNKGKKTESNVSKPIIPISTSSGSLWKVGDQCVAQWSQDNKWYNSQILNINAGRVHVLFVDYGNKEEPLDPPHQDGT